MNILKCTWLVGQARLTRKGHVRMSGLACPKDKCTSCLLSIGMVAQGLLPDRTIGCFIKKSMQDQIILETHNEFLEDPPVSKYAQFIAVRKSDLQGARNQTQQRFQTDKSHQIMMETSQPFYRIGLIRRCSSEKEQFGTFSIYCVRLKLVVANIQNNGKASTRASFFIG